MSWTCKGICVRDSHNQWKKGYSNGQRFCKTCDRYFQTDDSRCKCCNQILRRGRRYNGKLMGVIS